MKPLTAHLKLRETTVNLYAANKFFQMFLKAVKPYCTSQRGWKKETIPEQFKAGDDRHLPGSDHRFFFTVHRGSEESVLRGSLRKVDFASLDSCCWVTSISPRFSLPVSTSTRSVPPAAVLTWEPGITHGSKATGWPLPS